MFCFVLPYVTLLTRCCNFERRLILEGNVVPCAHRSTARLPHNACHPVPCPLKNERRAILKSIHLIKREILLLKRAVWLLGHVQPSTHSSLQTSWMLRLWQFVEQALVHSLYCIPMGHLGTLRQNRTNNHTLTVSCRTAILIID